ncbi:hypothetical protein [Hyalangium versicolor]|uniref:hypothetical protein n=1 Tax=Hyalangium versicolor TaxID=2861190 RepID=UPI001CCFFF83|nr:hypothetical protein [Hyalangium versicolor]
MNAVGIILGTMATRSKTQKKSPAKKAAAKKKSPSRILLPSGATDTGGSQSSKADKGGKKRILLPAGVTDDGGKKARSKKGSR